MKRSKSTKPIYCYLLWKNFILFQASIKTYIHQLSNSINPGFFNKSVLPIDARVLGGFGYSNKMRYEDSLVNCAFFLFLMPMAICNNSFTFCKTRAAFKTITETF